MKRFGVLFLSALLVVSAASACCAAYPEKTLQGYIMWGAGGGTDNFARAITPLVEKHLGNTIILQNKVGASGAVATTLIVNSPADGYSLLYGAENPANYRVLGLSQLSFHDLEPIVLAVAAAVVAAAHPDDLPFFLRQAVSFLKSKDVPINWHQLMRDINHWNHPDRFVQHNWANAFWGYKPEA